MGPQTHQTTIEELRINASMSSQVYDIPQMVV